MLVKEDGGDGEGIREAEAAVMQIKFSAQTMALCLQYLMNLQQCKLSDKNTNKNTKALVLGHPV